MKNWKYTYYQQKGVSHSVCQDCVRVFSDSQRVVACLCDGLGSLNHSDLAAEITVKTVIESLRETKPFRFSDVGTANLKHFKTNLIAKIQNRLREEAVKRGIPVNSMDCTLLFVCLFPQYDTALYGNLGDSALCVIRDNPYTDIFCDSTFVGTRAVMDKDAAQMIHCDVIPLDDHVKSFLLTSDGLENEIYFKGLDFLSRNTELYLNAMLDEQPKETIRKRIRLLTAERDTIFDDDISIAVISCANQRIALEPEPTWPCICGTENPLYETFCTNCSSDFLDLYKNIDFKGNKTAFFREVQRDPKKKMELTAAIRGGNAVSYGNNFSVEAPFAQNQGFRVPNQPRRNGSGLKPQAAAPLNPPNQFSRSTVSAPNLQSQTASRVVSRPSDTETTSFREQEMLSAPGVSQAENKSGSAAITVVLVIVALIFGMLVSGLLVAALKENKISDLQAQLSQALEMATDSEPKEQEPDSTDPTVTDEAAANAGQTDPSAFPGYDAYQNEQEDDTISYSPDDFF